MSGTTAATVPVAGFPAVPGLRIRRYTGPSDHAGMAAANNAWRTSLGVRELVTVEALDNLYGNLTNSDPYRDCLVLEVNGRVVGYSRTEWADGLSSDGRVFEVTLVLEPALASEAAYLALLGDGERRLLTDHAGRGRRPGDRFRAWTWDGDPMLEAAYATAGYAPARHFYDMIRPTLDDLPVAPLPTGLEVRPVRPEQWRAVWEADVEAFRDHWGETDEGETGFRRFLGEPHQVPELWQVAWDGEQVAGHVLVTINPEENRAFGTRRGVLDSVAVRRPWRRRGLARALIVGALAALREHGETSASLGVDVDNAHRALDLYTSCGFEADVSGTAYERAIGGAEG